LVPIICSPQSNRIAFQRANLMAHPAAADYIKNSDLLELQTNWN
jgi:hypothetical protein